VSAHAPMHVKIGSSDASASDERPDKANWRPPTTYQAFTFNDEDDEEDADDDASANGGSFQISEQSTRPTRPSRRAPDSDSFNSDEPTRPNKRPIARPPTQYRRPPKDDSDAPKDVKVRPPTQYRRMRDDDEEESESFQRKQKTKKSKPKPKPASWGVLKNTVGDDEQMHRAATGSVTFEDEDYEIEAEEEGGCLDEVHDCGTLPVSHHRKPLCPTSHLGSRCSRCPASLTSDGCSVCHARPRLALTWRATPLCAQRWRCAR
jgi:hypothetical protein